MAPPTSINELVWYLLVGASGILLYNIRVEIKGMRDDLKEERRHRESLATRVMSLSRDMAIIKAKNKCGIFTNYVDEDEGAGIYD